MSTADERRQRIREQMARFYGDPNAKREPRHSTARGTPGVPPELDLDSEFFNVSKYTTELLRRESLKGLVEADTQLLRSVRKLDSELQELVYQNYAKFISATDTIREMKDNVTEMDTKLQALSSTVSNIDEVSKSISGKLQQHRTRIEGTISTNRKLRKVRFLVALPATMRQLLEKKEYSACVKYWIVGDGFLKRHEAIPRIAAIHAECHALARQLYTDIEQAMCAYPLDDLDAMDVIRKFVEDLRLLRATSLFSGDESEATVKGDATSFEGAVLRVLMKSVSENFKTGIAAVHRSLRTAMAIPPSSLEGGSEDLQGLCEPLVRADLRESLAQLKSSCALLSVNSERVYSIVNRLEGADVTMHVTQEVQPVLIDVLDPIGKQLGELAATVFKTLCVKAGAKAAASCVLYGQGSSYNKNSPDAIKTAVHTAVTALSKQLKHIAMTLRTLGANYLDTAHSRQSKYYGTLVDQCVGEVIRRCLGACEEVLHDRPASAIAKPPDAAERVVEVSEACMVFSMGRFLLASLAAQLGETLMTDFGSDASGTALSREKCAEVTAELSEAARALHHRGIVLLGQSEMTLTVQDAFAAISGVSGPAQQQPSVTGSDVVVSPCLCSLLAEWAAVYKFLTTQHPAQPLSSITHTNKRSNVGGASSMSGASTGAAVGLVSSYHGASSALYGGASGTGGLTSLSAGAGNGTGSSNGRSSAAAGRSRARPMASYTRNEAAALQNTVARIFIREADTLRTRPTDGHASTTIGCLVLFVLKAIVDMVRLEAGFDSRGFQRVQANCTYLLRALVAPHKGTAPREWVKKWAASSGGDSLAQSMEQLLNEACTCAYERYSTKVPLTDIVLDRVVEEALNKKEELLAAPSSAPWMANSSMSKAPAAAAAAVPTLPTPILTESTATTTTDKAEAATSNESARAEELVGTDSIVLPTGINVTVPLSRTAESRPSSSPAGTTAATASAITKKEATATPSAAITGSGGQKSKKQAEASVFGGVESRMDFDDEELPI